MFFGKSEAEKVNSDSLEELLNSLFTKKLGSFEPKAANLVKELNTAKLQFGEVCRRFGELDVEPYTEDLYSANINSIKTQKSLYSKALEHIADGLVLEHSASNPYTKYNMILSNLEENINEMLKSNSKFKLVVYCYSNHLGAFKKSFSYIERLRDLLKGEIERRSKEFSEYTTLAEHISQLMILGEELEAIQNSLASLENSPVHSDQSAITKEEDEIEKKLSSTRSELTDIENQISDTTNRISRLLSPLDKAARKFDHASEGKKQLHHFIENPSGTIRDESEYNGLIVLIKELKKSLDADKIDVKNKSEIATSIELLLNANIYSMINSLKPLEMKRSDLNGEIRSLGRTHDSLTESTKTKEKSIHEKESMEKRAAELASSRVSKKAVLEDLFLGYYGKRISIAL